MNQVRNNFLLQESDDRNALNNYGFIRATMGIRIAILGRYGRTRCKLGI